jgi:hypothetical protein
MIPSELRLEIKESLLKYAQNTANLPEAKDREDLAEQYATTLMIQIHRSYVPPGAKPHVREVGGGIEATSDEEAVPE